MNARRIVRYMVGVICVLGLWESQIRAEDRKTEVLTSIGETTLCDRAPGLAGWLLGGKEIWSLERLLRRSRKGADVGGVVIGFFATWCKSCRAGLLLLQQESKKPGREAVVFVLVAIPPFPEPVADYLTALDVTLPTIEDKYGAVWEQWTKMHAENDSSTSLPRTVVVNSEQLLIGTLGAEGHDYSALIGRALDGLSTRCTGADTQKEHK